MASFRAPRCSRALLAVIALLAAALLRRRGRRVREARVAFFVQVSAASVLQLPRLLHALWHPDNRYIVHFDAKIGGERRRVMREFLAASARYSTNVVVLPSEPVSYAGVSMVLNTVNGVAAALELGPWDFFINLSGSDYPLVAPSVVREALHGAREARVNFLQRQVADRGMDWFFARRVGKVYVDTALLGGVGGELLDVNASHPGAELGEIAFVKAEGWMVLHRSFCEYVVTSSAARRLLLAFANARAADEHYFATLIAAEGRFAVAWDALRYIAWGPRTGKRWARPGFLDGEESSELVEELVESGALFARKFSAPESAVLDYIDANVSGAWERDYGAVAALSRRFRARAKRRTACIVQFRDPEGDQSTEYAKCMRSDMPA